MWIVILWCLGMSLPTFRQRTAFVFLFMLLSADPSFGQGSGPSSSPSTIGLAAPDTGNLATVANGVGAQGTGSSYNPPTGGTGQIGYLSGIFKAVTGTLNVAISAPVAVTGTFFQATQPVSVSSLPLPSGAAQDGVDGSGISPPTSGSGIRGWLSGIYKAVTGTLTVSVSGTVPVSGTFWQSTQPISAASLPLPSGAAQDGTDATGVTAPAGAAGLRGWLSGIYNRLGGTLNVAIHPVTSSGAYQTPVTVGTSATTLVTAGQAVVFLDIQNGCVSQNMTLTVGSNIARVLVPMGTYTREGSYVPGDAITATVPSGTCPAYIGVK